MKPKHLKHWPCGCFTGQDEGDVLYLQSCKRPNCKITPRMIEESIRSGNRLLDLDGKPVEWRET